MKGQSLSTVLLQVHLAYGLPAGSVKYIDEEGDHISLDSEGEWVESRGVVSGGDLLHGSVTKCIATYTMVISRLGHCLYSTAQMQGINFTHAFCV